MRIALATCVYPPYRGGIGSVAARHADLLREIGHEVEVMTPGRDGDWAVNTSGTRRQRPLLRHGNSAFVPQLATAVGSFDALYLHYPFYGGAEPAALGARLAGVPYVAFFHMDVAWSGWRGRFISVYERTLAPLILRGASTVFVSSHDYAERSSLSEYALTNLVERPYGVDTERFSPRVISDDQRRALGIDPGRKIVLFVGAMDRGHDFKGVPQLLEAFAAANIGSSAQLVLVGDGERRSVYESAARSHGVADAVFLGRASDEDLLAAYQAADVTVLPSTTGEEAFGIVLIEAMACGCPVIASDLPGVRTVAREELGGRRVPPGDVASLSQSLREVVEDPSWNERRGAARTGACERFSREAERETLAETFAGLMR